MKSTKVNWSSSQDPHHHSLNFNFQVKGTLEKRAPVSKQLLFPFPGSGQILIQWL